MILTLALGLFLTVGAIAQNAKGDWYIGTGDIANVAWTEWSISPTVGYAVTDDLMIGLNVSQADSERGPNVEFQKQTPPLFCFFSGTAK